MNLQGRYRAARAAKKLKLRRKTRKQTRQKREEEKLDSKLGNVFSRGARWKGGSHLGVGWVWVD